MNAASVTSAGPGGLQRLSAVPQRSSLYAFAVRPRNGLANEVNIHLMRYDAFSCFHPGHQGTPADGLRILDPKPLLQVQRCSCTPTTCRAQTADQYTVTDRTRLKRYAKRAEYDRKVVHAILDEVWRSGAPPRKCHHMHDTMKPQPASISDGQ